MWRDRHMFEVEQVDYEKEQIDWSYITFNDNKVQYCSSVPLLLIPYLLNNRGVTCLFMIAVP